MLDITMLHDIQDMVLRLEHLLKQATDNITSSKDIREEISRLKEAILAATNKMNIEAMTQATVVDVPPPEESDDGSTIHSGVRPQGKTQSRRMAYLLSLP